MREKVESIKSIQAASLGRTSRTSKKELFLVIITSLSSAGGSGTFSQFQSTNAYHISTSMNESTPVVYHLRHLIPSKTLPSQEVLLPHTYGRFTKPSNQLSNIEINPEVFEVLSPLDPTKSPGCDRAQQS